MTRQKIQKIRWAAFAAFVLGGIIPRAASAIQDAELYRSPPYFYGRFEARIRFAPGDGVVSAFFLWKDGSSSTTTWNELDFEKFTAACKLQTNIWTGQGTQSNQIQTPTFNVCDDYHTYAFEWTPDYIAWLLDGVQIRKVTGASVAEYTQNASQGMSIHFNTWVGNADFGGVLDPSILPVQQYISWAQYSSYTGGAFQLQWRENFDGTTMPSGWAAGNWPSAYNLSTHNPQNVNFADGIAVLSMTTDDATGYTGTPPVDLGADAGVPPDGSFPISMSNPPGVGGVGSGGGCSCRAGGSAPANGGGLVAVLLMGAWVLLRARRRAPSSR
jgi:endo-1,3-1,4-beta-glycanase ExoK